MVDIQLTEDLGKPISGVKIDVSHPSSLLKYAKTELLHLTVAPDFLQRASQPLSIAAPNPLSFQLKVEHDFQLGNIQPKITLTPSFQATVRVNASAGANLFDENPFPVISTVPPKTGYVSLGLQGSLDLGASGSTGELTFGFGANSRVSLDYWKAFPLDDAEPTLGQATGEMISDFVIPAELDDLELLAVNDVCAVSGEGSLKISSGFGVSVVPNPLASVDLPLNAGTVQVKTGVVAGIAASFAVSGGYQLRVRRTAPDSLELSFCKQKGTALKADFSASGGVAVKFGGTDLLSGLLDAISSDPGDEATKKLFQDGGLSQSEIAILTDAVKDSLDHSLQAAIDVALSRITDDQAAFQYEIRPASLDANASSAIHRALEGDLSGLTALEAENQGAQLAPGITLLSSVLTTVRKQKTTLALNLFGLVNFLSVSDLVRNCVVIKEPESGYLTIADRATADRINAVVEPLRRRQALRKAMFESLMLTATYRTSNAISMPGLTSHNFHFAFNDNTKTSILADYLNWLVVMNLLTEEEKNSYLKQFVGGGPSTCLLRTEFEDRACQSLFFEAPGRLRNATYYLDIGRQTMRALIDPNNTEVDKFRYTLLDQHWQQALDIGPVDSLGELMGLHLTDSRESNIIQFLKSDVYTISWWADAMQRAGKSILDMQQFLAGANPATLADNQEFANRRSKLQKEMSKVIASSRTQFEEPWGLIALFRASGSTGAFARIVAKDLLMQQPNAS